MNREITIHRIVTELAHAVYNESPALLNVPDDYDPIGVIEKSVRLCARDLVENGNITQKSPANRPHSFSPAETATLLDNLLDRTQNPTDADIKKILNGMTITREAITKTKDLLKQSFFPPNTSPRKKMC